jgi:hypothetical protein
MDIVSGIDTPRGLLMSQIGLNENNCCGSWWKKQSCAKMRLARHVSYDKEANAGQEFKRSKYCIEGGFVFPF